VRLQASLRSIRRTPLAYQPLPPAAREVAIKQRIDAVVTAYPFYEARKVQARLEPAFGPMARTRVRRSMPERARAAGYPGPNLSCPVALKTTIPASSVGGASDSGDTIASLTAFHTCFATSNSVVRPDALDPGDGGDQQHDRVPDRAHPSQCSR